MEVITEAEMRDLERRTFESGAVSGPELMERAGQSVFDAVFEEWPELAEGTHRAMVLCGPGNNGGDGYVVARLLKEAGWQVDVHAFGDTAKLPPDAKANHARWQELGPTKLFGRGLVIEDHDLIVDALFGIGQSRPLPTEIQSFAAHATIMSGVGNARMVSVDVPSGVATDSGEPLGEAQIFADLTVTFHRAKPCHTDAEGGKRCGKVVVRDIGL